ncbi:MAG: HD domain-containing phosphohydrolase [bacterium]
MTPNAKIMIVEDERIIAEDLRNTLQSLGYTVMKIVSTGEEAINILKKNKPDLILADIVLSGQIDGIEMAKYIKSRYNIPIVYLTAYADKNIVTRAKITEPYGYIIKPFEDRELQTNIEIALYKNKIEARLKENFDERNRALEATVAALATAVEMRDPYTAGHQQRVAQLACAIVRKLGLSKDKIEAIRIAATIHDIGKIHVPAEILGKPAKLTESEFEIVQCHPQIGYDILKNIEFPWPIAQIVLQHHERLNGSGYPKGLDDDNILLEAQILAVADVTEAMLSHRPYRPAHNLKETLDEISKNKGVLFDPKTVDACTKLFREKEFIFGD